MIVPHYWAEARTQQARGKDRRQITVRRLGWSDVSQADAQHMADVRAREALTRLVAGEKFTRHEPKRGYNGAKGVPIREEVLERHGDVVITRNSYGAHCLNTPDVVFADIDFCAEPSFRVALSYTLGLCVTAILVAVWYRSLAIGLVGVFLSLISGSMLASVARRIGQLLGGGAEAVALRRVRRFSQCNPAWHLRLYRTPAGLRVLVMDRTWSVAANEVGAFFSALKVDPIYAKMCVNQACFRARVSPKPWRLGIKAHMRPRPGVWPVHPDRLPLREAWVRAYEAAAATRASCQFVERLGSETSHPKADAVRVLHDNKARALSKMELA